MKRIIIVLSLACVLLGSIAAEPNSNERLIVEDPIWVHSIGVHA